MYRACSTWQYEVIAHLLERHRGGIRLGYLTGEQFEQRDDREGDDGTWKVLKSHEEHGRFAWALAEGRAVAVYAHRDVRDVVFSLMHKRKIDFETLVGQGMVHQVLANDRFWSGQPGSIAQRYDRLVADPTTGVEELAAHLRLPLKPGEAAEVAAEYSFQANRRRTMELGQRLQRGGVDLDDPSIAQAHDRRTLLHWNHMRDGRVGDWRGRATPRQRVALARICGRWLEAHGYERDDPSAIAEALKVETSTTVREPSAGSWRWPEGPSPVRSDASRSATPGSPGPSSRSWGSPPRPRWRLPPRSTCRRISASTTRPRPRPLSRTDGARSTE